MGNNYFVLDDNYLANIEAKFEQKREMAWSRRHQLFDIFNQDMSDEEKTALKFLYAFMSKLIKLFNY